MEINESIRKEALRRGYSSKTIKTYCDCVERFFRYCKEEPKKVTKKDIKEFLNKLADNGKSGNTINVYLNSLKFLFEELLGKRMKLNIRYSKKPVKLPVVLSKEEIKKLFNAIENPKHKLMIQLMYSAGLRVSELINLKPEDLELEKNYGWVRHGKGNKDRLFIVAEALKEDIKKFIGSKKLNEYNFLFTSIKGRKYDVRSLQQIIKKARIKARIDKRISCHTLRHCLHPNTRIFSNCGIYTVRNFNKSNIQSYNFNNMDSVFANNIIKFKHNSKKILSILADGYEILCTPKHRLFTIGKEGIEEKRAQNIHKGDWIIGIKQVRFTGKNTKKGVNFWRLVGYILGDGVVSERRRGVFAYDKDKSILKFYKTIVDKLYNINSKIVKLKDRNSYCLNMYSTQIVKELIKYGLNNISKNKYAPIDLMSATLKEICAFIAGFYDADGNSGYIRFFSSSKELLKDIQMLLLRLGIDSHLATRNRKVRLPQGKKILHTIFELQIIHLPDQKRFFKKIPTLKSKSIRFENNFYGEKIPVCPIIKKLRSRYITKKNMPYAVIEREAKKLGIRTIRYETINPTKKSLIKLIKVFKDVATDKELSILKKICYAKNIKWLRVKKNENFQYFGEVFDFHIPKYECLITNGILSHNSFATHLIENGNSITEVQALLGHKSPETTFVYIHTANPKLINIKSPFDNL